MWDVHGNPFSKLFWDDLQPGIRVSFNNLQPPTDPCTGQQLGNISSVKFFTVDPYFGVGFYRSPVRHIEKYQPWNIVDQGQLQPKLRMLDLLGPHNSFFFINTSFKLNPVTLNLKVLPNFYIIYFHCKSVNSASTSASFEFWKLIKGWRRIVMSKNLMELFFRLCFVKLKLLLLAIEVIMIDVNSD